MKLLPDTHILLWAAGQPEKLSGTARTLLSDEGNELLFSAASIWEISIKSGLGRDDFSADARLLQRGLLDNGWQELPVHARHAVSVQDLPPIHKDPFDRILVAQAMAEGVLLVTSDSIVAKYPGPIQLV